MASLYFSRDTKLFVKSPATFGETDHASASHHEIRILDGFSFSQSDNSTEITPNEGVVLDATVSTLNRNTHKFRTSNNPVDFSFQTYARPYKSTSTSATVLGGDSNPSSTFATTAAPVTAPEMILWAMFAGCNQINNTGTYRTPKGTTTVPTATTTKVQFSNSNIPRAYEEFELIFQIEEGDKPSVAGRFSTYTITKPIITECTIDFDLEGLATYTWTGQGATLINVEGQNQIDPAAATTINEGISTANFIQNKLSSVVIDPPSSPASVALNSGSNYTLVLTGGSITLSNNVTYLTPDEISRVNNPFTHFLGTLGVSGNITAYVEKGDNKSSDLFRDLSTSTNRTQNVALAITIGSGSSENVTFNITNAHLDLPTTNIEDVISVDIPFVGLSSNISTETIPSLDVIYTVPA